jgi:hypothetical protein
MHWEQELQYQPVVCHEMFAIRVQNIYKINLMFSLILLILENRIVLCKIITSTFFGVKESIANA